MIKKKNLEKAKPAECLSSIHNSEHILESLLPFWNDPGISQTCERGRRGENKTKQCTSFFFLFEMRL